MRLDFHSKRVSHHPGRQKESFQIPPLLRSLLTGAGIGLVCLGLVFYLLSFLFTRPGQYPYAITFFSGPKEKSDAEVSLLWVDEKRKTLTVVHLPSSLEFVSLRLGTYPMSTLYSAYAQSREKEDFLEQELSFFFRTQIEGVIRTEQTVSLNRATIARTVLSSCSTLGIRNCFHFAVVSMTPSFRLQDQVFPENLLGTKTPLGLQPLRRDVYATWLRDRFSNAFGIHGQTIAIVNASGISGAAKEAAVVLKDLGFSILSVSDTPTLVESGMFFTRSGTDIDPNITSFLTSFFQVPLEKDTAKTTQYRTDMVLVIGKTQAKFFTP